LTAQGRQLRGGFPRGFANFQDVFLMLMHGEILAGFGAEGESGL
jgi:hypothetical protein